MNILRTIKEFLLFKHFLNELQQIDLDEAEKVKLEAVDKNIIKKIVNKMGESLSRDMVNERISPDYAI
jgi:uncharacterized membrane protein